MRRPVRLALVLVLPIALAACADEDAAVCPGEPVATFHFAGTKVAAGDPALDPAPDVPDCTDDLGFPAAIAFQGTLAADPASSAGTLCRAQGPVLFGTRAGDHFAVETSTDGAVLGEQCAPTCSAGLSLLVTGDVVRVDGAAASFSGLLVEVMSAAAGSACGACALPCAARYALEGTP